MKKIDTAEYQKNLNLKVNPKIQELIDKKVLEAREDKEPSGRLSAGKLGWPLQWQMLHYFKVPQKPVDEYTLRKFQRGKDVEDRIVDWVNPQEKQTQVEYRGVVGIEDMLYEGIPHEIKSVTNMAFKHIQKEGTKLGHRLQGMLYAKARGTDKFAIVYVASDDYRVLCFEEQVTDEVDKIIDQYDAQVKLKTVPIFKPKEAWHSIAEYNPYFDWMLLNEEEIANYLSVINK